MTSDNNDDYFDGDGLRRCRDDVVALVTMASYDGDSATGDEINDDGDGATARQDTTTTAMTTDVDVYDNDDDDDDDTSSTTSDEGDNCRGRQSQSR
jgi:hypothetical protein